MDKKTKTDSTLMHDLSDSNLPLFSRKLIMILVGIALLGVLSGFLLSKVGRNSSGTGMMDKFTNSASIPAGTTFGSDDTETYKDVAEGVLKEGGIEDEGQYHLERPGGESQNVYLTSSLVDLSKLIGRKVKVWGQTQQAQYAGWLMDVGRLQVLD